MHFLCLLACERDNGDLGDFQSTVPTMNIACVFLIILYMDESISVKNFKKTRGFGLVGIK